MPQPHQSQDPASSHGRADHTAGTHGSGVRPARSLKIKDLFSGRLNLLLITSAAVYMVLNVLHTVARSTDHYRALVRETTERLGATVSPEVAEATGPTWFQVMFWLLVLLVYALVLVFVSTGNKAAWIVGIALAGLGSSLALFGIIYLPHYGSFAVAVGLGIVVYVGLNISWIVTAVRNR